MGEASPGPVLHALQLPLQELHRIAHVLELLLEVLLAGAQLAHRPLEQVQHRGGLRGEFLLLGLHLVQPGLVPHQLCVHGVHRLADVLLLLRLDPRLLPHHLQPVRKILLHGQKPLDVFPFQLRQARMEVLGERGVAGQLTCRLDRHRLMLLHVLVVPLVQLGGGALELLKVEGHLRPCGFRIALREILWNLLEPQRGTNRFR
mmetsp:Transcript_5357/g.11389  ORF Transcript_5357/g.11389 Transcript_5357/m.11389 type:complete len:203 (+) Transcript_5357:1223-1831(+)